MIELYLRSIIDRNGGNVTKGFELANSSGKMLETTI